MKFLVFGNLQELGEGDHISLNTLIAGECRNNAKFVTTEAGKEQYVIAAHLAYLKSKPFRFKGGKYLIETQVVPLAQGTEDIFGNEIVEGIEVIVNPCFSESGVHISVLPFIKDKPIRFLIDTSLFSLDISMDFPIAVIKLSSEYIEEEEEEESEKHMTKKDLIINIAEMSGKSKNSLKGMQTEELAELYETLIDADDDDATDYDDTDDDGDNTGDTE